MPSGFSSPASSGPTAGTYLPVAAPSGVTVDTTTYNNPVSGSGKLTTLVFPADNACLALAISGDAFPRVLINSDGSDALYMGDGIHDAYVSATGFIGQTFDSVGRKTQTSRLELTQAAAMIRDAVRMNQVSPKFTITSGALPTVQLVTATGAQISTTRDAETITPCTFNPGAATTATVTVELSSDNTTYSTLAVVTEPAGVALDGTILPVKVRVPAGWYLRLTVNAQAVLGLTTYY